MGIANQTTPLTRLNYAYDLRLFFQFLTSEISKFNKLTPPIFTLSDLTTVTATNIEMFLDYLNYYQIDKNKNRSNSESGKYRKLSTVRSLFRYFFNKEKLDANVAAKVQLPKLHEKEIIRLDMDEVVNILNEAESGDDLTSKQKDFHKKTWIRDLAILTLFLGTGIRISECVGLDVNDIDFKNNALTVTRKGGNRVILYFPNEVANALKNYLEQRNLNKRISPLEKALFISILNKRISIRATQDLVKKYSRLISPLKHITPHKLRSTFGTNLYRETQDIYIVAEVLGHKDINTTKKHYAAQSEDMRKKAANYVKLRDDNN